MEQRNLNDALGRLLGPAEPEIGCDACFEELDRFVDNNPNLFGVIVATAAATAMEVGAGTVDTLRFGEGMAEGGAKGEDQGEESSQNVHPHEERPGGRRPLR